MNPPDTHLDLLEKPLFAHFATRRSDGAPQVNPMWFLWDPESGTVKLTHTSERHNFRYVQEEPRIALSIIDPDSGYRYLSMRGVIERIEADPTGGFYQVLQQRYLGRTNEVKDRDVRVILHIRPTAWKAR